MSVHNEADLDQDERELAILEAWLDNEDLPEGTLFRELPWLRDKFMAGLTTLPATEPVDPSSHWRPLGWGQRTGSIFAGAVRSYATSLAPVGAQDPQKLPDGHLWGLTRDLQAIAIDCPLENGWNVAFPTGRALVEWVRGKQVERALLPVNVLQQTRRYYAWSELLELFPNLTTAELMEGTIYLTPVSLSPQLLTRVNNGQVTFQKGEEST